jgi:hypothetical protein
VLTPEESPDTLKAAITSTVGEMVDLNAAEKLSPHQLLPLNPKP